MLLGAVPSMAWQGEVKVETPNMLMLLTAQEGQDLRMAYFGARTATLQEVRDAGDDMNFPALPAFGTVDMIHLPAIQVQHANGDQNLELEVEGLTPDPSPKGEGGRKGEDKAASKREKSSASLSFSERKQVRPKVKGA